MTIEWWTLGFQTVNIVILVWLLGRFFWKPVAAIIEERRATAQTILADAEAKRSQATAALADIERTRAGFAEEREAILSSAHDTAAGERTALLVDASSEAVSLEAAAKTAIAKERDACEKAWVERAGLLAVEIAGRLASRLDGPKVRDTFLDWLLKAIHGLPEATRKEAGENSRSLKVISPAPLDPADQERYRGLIGEAFGSHPSITFTSDPALIAGLELHGPHLAVSNSWRADLGHILEGIAREDRH
jgi:F-type H+-transporting ATPase subunit b